MARHLRRRADTRGAVFAVAARCPQDGSEIKEALMVRA